MRFFIFPVVVTALNYLRITIEEEERLLLSRVLSLFLSNMSQQGKKNPKTKEQTCLPCGRQEDGEPEGVQAGRHRETAILATGYLPP